MNQIGQRIKALRNAENLTQENLAEELNVSFQSVSRWENGTSTPDISLLPIIARFFKVTTDYLLGIEDEEAEYTKRDIEQNYLEKRSLGDLDGAYGVLLEGRKIFPRDYHICVELADLMNLFEGGTGSQISMYKELNFSSQIYSLCSRVLEGSKEEADRSKALSLLADYYVKSGNTAEALKIADSVTDLMHSKEILLSEIFSGTDKKKRIQENIVLMVEYISNNLVKIAFQKEYGFSATMSPKEKLEYVIAANSVIKSVFTDGNYLVFARKLCWNYRRMAELYLLMNDKKNALDCLLEAEKMAEKYDLFAQSEACRYTSLICNQVDSKTEDGGKYYVGTEKEMLAYRLNEMKDYFAENEEFLALQERLGKQRIVI